MKIIKIKAKGAVEIALNVIKDGGVVVFPTDTVYGLICDSNNKEAVEKIFKIKKRSKGKPISIFVNDIDAAKKFTKVSKKNERFLMNNWPGAITAVLEKRVNIFTAIHQGKNTIGVRIPDYLPINKLISGNNAPIAETSANISGEPATTEIKKVLKYFKDKDPAPDLIIDAGDLPKRRPSKVVDLTGSKINIIRE